MARGGWPPLSDHVSEQLGPDFRRCLLPGVCAEGRAGCVDVGLTSWPTLSAVIDSRMALGKWPPLSDQVSEQLGYDRFLRFDVLAGFDSEHKIYYRKEHITS